MLADIFIESIQAIQRNKLRSAATGFAVTSGIFLLIVLLGAGNGVIHTLENNSRTLALDAVYIYPGWTSKPYAGYTADRQIKLIENDADRAKNVSPDKVLQASISYEQGGTIVTEDNKSLNVTLNGTDPLFTRNMDYTVLKGRFLNPIDMKEKRKVVVICESLAKRLFGEGNSVVGKEIRIDGFAYQIIGLMKDNNSRYNDYAMIPQTTLVGIYNKHDEVSNIILKTKGLETKPAYDVFEQTYKKVMATTHDFAPDDDRAIFMFGGGANAEVMDTAFSVISTSFWILGILTLLSGITGVSNIMLISVRERTREFGIRKAIGATPLHIVTMVLAESIFITTIAGYIGMVLGIAFCEYMDSSVGSSVADFGSGMEFQYFQDPTVGMDICINATLVMIIAGAIAGFIPARKAAKMKPIDSLNAK